MATTSGACARYISTAAAAVFGALALTGCASTSQPDGVSHEAGGAVLGAVAGGLIGSQVAGRDPLAGAVIGAAAGAVVGGVIGAALDEEDRREMERLTQASFETGKPQEYVSPRTGSRVKVHVVKTARVKRQVCRTAQQDVELKDGGVSSEKVTACKGPGGWVV